MKKLIHSALISLITSLSLLGSSSLQAEEVLLDKVAAVVNDQIILKSELSGKVYEQAQAMAAQNIPVRDAQALSQKVLDNMILELLQLERANQVGLKATDEEINQQMQNLAEQNNISLFELRNRLNLQAPEGFQKVRENFKKQILIQKLREKEVISQAYVTESEIENYLKRQALAKSNVQVRLAHILVSIPESATPDERQNALSKIKEIKNRLNTGEDFSQLAVRYSDGGKALQGGDLGWMSEAEVPTFFSEAVEGLKNGEISKIIESPSGFHLIKLVDKKDLGTIQAKTEYHLFRFVILNDEKNPRNVPEEITTLAAEMDSIQDFQALFEKYSDIPAEINKNSDLGWRTLDRIPAVIQQDVANLSAKQALPPMLTDNGWMILYLDDVREISNASDSERKKAIQTIRMRKANEMFDLWLRRLKDEAFIQIK